MNPQKPGNPQKGSLNNLKGLDVTGGFRISMEGELPAPLFVQRFQKPINQQKSDNWPDDKNQMLTYVSIESLGSRTARLHLWVFRILCGWIL